MRRRDRGARTLRFGTSGSRSRVAVAEEVADPDEQPAVGGRTRACRRWPGRRTTGPVQTMRGGRASSGGDLADDEPPSAPVQLANSRPARVRARPTSPRAGRWAPDGRDVSRPAWTPTCRRGRLTDPPGEPLAVEEAPVGQRNRRDREPRPSAPIDGPHEDPPGGRRGADASAASVHATKSDDARTGGGALRTCVASRPSGLRRRSGAPWESASPVRAAGAVSPARSRVVGIRRCRSRAWRRRELAVCPADRAAGRVLVDVAVGTIGQLAARRRDPRSRRAAAAAPSRRRPSRPWAARHFGDRCPWSSSGRRIGVRPCR